MAPESSCDGELSGSPGTSQAADFSDDPNDLCDQVSNELTSNISESQYVDRIDGNAIFTNVTNSLILMHLNIRSLNKYISDLHTFLSTLPFKPDVISLSEARIHQPLQNIDICGYNLISGDSGTPATRAEPELQNDAEATRAEPKLRNDGRLVII